MLVQLHLLDKVRRHLQIAVGWRQKAKYNPAYAGLVDRVNKSWWLVYGRIAGRRSLFALRLIGRWRNSHCRNNRDQCWTQLAKG